MCPKDTEARPDDSWVLYRDYLESMGALDDASKHSNKCKTSVSATTKMLLENFEFSTKKICIIYH